MKPLSYILADLIRDGEVTINIPGLDPEELDRLVNHEARETMQKMRYVLGCDDLTNGEKVAMLRGYMEGW